MIYSLLGVNMDDKQTAEGRALVAGAEQIRDLKAENAELRKLLAQEQSFSARVKKRLDAVTAERDKAQAEYQECLDLIPM